jgi:hypothetical protein
VTFSFNRGDRRQPWGRLAVVAPTLFRHGEEEGGQRVRVGQLATGPIGPEAEKNPFRIKIRFLNLHGLWKFALGDLGGILTQGFFLNSSRILKEFYKM